MAGRPGDRQAERGLPHRSAAVDGPVLAPLGRLARRPPPARVPGGPVERAGHRPHARGPRRAHHRDERRRGRGVAPDGKEIALAFHGDSTVADNTNVDVYLMGPDGGGSRAFTTGKGADNTPRFSPDGKWLSWLSMERAGFEADRQRLMLAGRSDGRTVGQPVEATAGWTLSVSAYTWCPDSKCVYAVIEERGRDNVYRLVVRSFRHSFAHSRAGLHTNVTA